MSCTMTLDVDFDQTMHALGADGAVLSSNAAAELERDGYTVLPGILDKAELEHLRMRVDQLFEHAEKEGTLFRDSGSPMLIDLVNKGPEFDRVWSHPVVLAAVRSVIARPFKLFWLNSRDQPAGLPGGDLHADWSSPRAPAESHHVCNSIWALDDMSAENGATRIVPGSHKSVGLFHDHVPDRMAPHPREVSVTAKAGSVVVFNSHCWHRPGRNTTGARRRVLLGYYMARDIPVKEEHGHFFQSERLRVATAARLSPAQRWLLNA